MTTSTTGTGKRLSDVGAQNTDREVWRERTGDYYSPSIHITKEGGVGINVAGAVIVMPIRSWHQIGLANAHPIAPKSPPPSQGKVERARESLAKYVAETDVSGEDQKDILAGRESVRIWASAAIAAISAALTEPAQGTNVEAMREVVYLREVDAGTDNACWVVCNEVDDGAVAFEPVTP